MRLKSKLGWLKLVLLLAVGVGTGLVSYPLLLRVLSPVPIYWLSLSALVLIPLLLLVWFWTHGLPHLPKRLSLDPSQWTWADPQVRMIIDNLPALIAYVGSDGRYRMVNQSYTRVFAKPMDAFVGKSMGTVVASEQHETFQDNIRRALAGESVNFESEVIDDQGKLRCFSGSFVPDRDRRRKVRGFFAFGFDISDRKNAEKEHCILSDTAKLFTSSLDAQLILKTLACRIVPEYADVCIVELLDDDQNLQLATYEDADHSLKPTPSLQKRLSELSLEVLANAQPMRLEAKDFTDEEQLIRSGVISPIQARGKNMGTLGIFSRKSRASFCEISLDLTQELGNRTGIAIDNSQLYHGSLVLNRVKDEFLATLSHELRTPLNVIVGWADLIVNGEVEADEIVAAAQIIQRNAHTQTQIVNDLLDMSTIITGKLRFSPRPVSLVALVKSVAPSIKLAAAAKDMNVSTRFDERSGLVLGDPDRLMQVLWNLLSNALKFTPARGSIRIETKRVGGSCELRVSDNGQGIDPEFQPYIFDRFRQEDSRITRKYGGLGLGLSISKEIIELHGAEIRVESPGKGLGTTFIVSMPIAAELSPKNLQSMMKSEGETPPITHNSSLQQTLAEKPLRGVNVIAVDDDPGSRQLLNVLLKRSGADVRSADSARAALDLFQARIPDIVISDIGMPEEDGYSLIRRIRRIAPDRGGRTPGIALTAYAREEEREGALRAGFQAHLPKPVDPLTLIREVVRLTAPTKPNRETESHFH